MRLFKLVDIIVHSDRQSVVKWNACKICKFGVNFFTSMYSKLCYLASALGAENGVPDWIYG